MSESKTLFLTGGTGYVGRSVIEQAIGEGWEVRSLSRNEQGDEKLQALGAVPVRGDLTSIKVIREEAKNADAIIALATAYVLGEKAYEDSGLITDNAAFDAMAEQFVGTNKPIVMTSGTLLVKPDPTGAETNEDSPPDPNPLNARWKHTDYALSWASKGVRVIAVKLAPWVYGRGGSGVGLFLGMAMKNGTMTTIDGSKNRTTIVHVDDAASLYLLAVEKAEAGEVFNASSSTQTVAGDMYLAIANAAGVPVVDMSMEEALSKLGFLAKFFSADNRASGEKARRVLGWEPKGVGILDDIYTGSYQLAAESLKKGSA